MEGRGGERENEREREKASARRFSFHQSTRQTDTGTVSKVTLVETSEKRGGAYTGFPEHRDTISN